jgi:hypothetical protein
MAVILLKAIPTRKLRTMQEFDLLQRQVNLMKTMHHPFIAGLFGVLDDEENFYLVIKFVPHRRRHLRRFLGGQVRRRRLVRLPGHYGRPTDDRQRLGRRHAVEWGCSQRLRWRLCPHFTQSDERRATIEIASTYFIEMDSLTFNEAELQ